jgi:hypothetical protein
MRFSISLLALACTAYVLIEAAFKFMRLVHWLAAAPPW